MDNNLILKRLTLKSTLKPFDCNDSDLNNFFHDDALDFSKQLLAVTYVLENKKETGCRFVTANAYKASLGFYAKNGFKFLTDKDKNEDTRLMYLDLFPFRKS